MRKSLRYKLIEHFVLCLVIIAITLLVAAIQRGREISVAVSENESPQKDSQSIGEAPSFELPRIVIDAGHGGRDCGAVGVDGLLEKDVNLAISLIIKEELERVGYEVLLTRDSDIMLESTEREFGTLKESDLYERVRIAKSGDIFVSVHMNKFSEEKYKGTQVYYSTQNADSRTLAEMIQKGVRENIQADNNRQIKNGEGLYLLDRLDIPAVIVECGFLSNREECADLGTEEYRNALAYEIFSAIDDFVIELTDK